MKILFSSDLHGSLDAYSGFSSLLKYADIGILGGDLNTGFSPSEFEEIRMKYKINDDDLLEELHSEEDSLPIAPNLKLLAAYKEKEHVYKKILEEGNKPVFFIMGNDDGLVGGEWDDTKLLINVNMKRIDLNKINIVGYQYTLPFVGGKFEKDEKQQEYDFKKLSELIDTDTVFVSHGPAFMENDLLFNQLNGKKERIGSKMLRRLLRKCKPMYHLYGHYHQKFGIEENSINGSYPYTKKYVFIDSESGQISWMSSEEKQV